MKYFYFYELPSGRIRSKGACADGDYSLQNNPGLVKAEGQPLLEGQYVVDGALANRPSMSLTQIDKVEVIAGGVGVVTISSIPADAVAQIKGGGAVVTSDPVTDGSLELSFDTEGEYKIKLSKFPYKDKEFVINAS